MGQLYGDRWEGVEGDLGRGGQSLVLTVVDRRGEFEGRYALKRLLNPRREERFRNEVDAVKTLRHPNVIPLLDHSALDQSASSPPSTRYIVMPIATGGDLSKYAAGFEGDLPRVLDVAIQVAEALNAAHQAKIVHRDIKPENVLLSGTNDQVWVSDFGICLIDDGRSRATPVGEVVGPALFMAPELEGGDNLAANPSVDVYSLGKLIFYLFSGGMRVPREAISEARYASWLEAPGLSGLRLLITQMVCPAHARIATMEVVLHRLKHLRTPPRDVASLRRVSSRTRLRNRGWPKTSASRRSRPRRDGRRRPSSRQPSLRCRTSSTISSARAPRLSMCKG